MCKVETEYLQPQYEGKPAITFLTSEIPLKIQFCDWRLPSIEQTVHTGREKKQLREMEALNDVQGQG